MSGGEIPESPAGSRSTNCPGTAGANASSSVTAARERRRGPIAITRPPPCSTNSPTARMAPASRRPGSRTSATRLPSSAPRTAPSPRTGAWSRRKPGATPTPSASRTYTEGGLPPRSATRMAASGWITKWKRSSPARASSGSRTSAARGSLGRRTGENLAVADRSALAVRLCRSTVLPESRSSTSPSHSGRWEDGAKRISADTTS